MESGVFLNPDVNRIEQIRAKKNATRQAKKAHEELINRVEFLELRVSQLEELLATLSSKTL